MAIETSDSIIGDVVDDVPEEEMLSLLEGEEEPEEIIVEEAVVTEEPIVVDPLDENRFSQKDLDRIVGQSRIKGREYEEEAQRLEKATGMSLKEITNYVLEQEVSKMVEETGIPENEARKIVDDRQRVGYLEEQLQQLQQQQQISQQIMSYNQEKTKFIKSPVVKKYEAEIDAFTQGGKVLGFEAGMKYVLGEKMLSGEITESIRTSTQAKTLANVNKRSQAAPIAGAQAGGTVSQVPKELRGLAKAFGMEEDFKDIAEEYEKEQKRRGGR